MVDAVQAPGTYEEFDEFARDHDLLMETAWNHGSAMAFVRSYFGNRLRIIQAKVLWYARHLVLSGEGTAAAGWCVAVIVGFASPVLSALLQSATPLWAQCTSTVLTN